MAALWNRPLRNLDPDDVRMTLGEHLEELRSRLIRAIIGLAVGAVICFVCIGPIMGFLTSPLYAVLDAQGYPRDMKALHPAEGFITDLKVSFIVGFMVSAPYSLAQIWGFVAAGLYPKERRWVSRFAPVSVALFFTGAVFLLLVVSPLLLNFLISYRTEYPSLGRFFSGWVLTSHKALTTDIDELDQPWPTSQPITVFNAEPKDPPERVPWLNLGKREIRMRVGDDRYTVAHLRKVTEGNRVTPEMRIGEFIPFILQLAAAFGIGFQVPVVVTFLAATGIVEARQMAQLRRYVIFGMGVASAVITPPDPGSMLMLLGPMVLLYEIGLFVARVIERKREEPAT